VDEKKSKKTKTTWDYEGYCIEQKREKRKRKKNQD
jgi:hypothetical protein